MKRYNVIVKQVLLDMKNVLFLKNFGVDNLATKGGQFALILCGHFERYLQDDIRIAVANGIRKPMEVFISLVHEQISLEHRQWPKTAENINKSIDIIQESLQSRDGQKNT